MFYVYIHTRLDTGEIFYVGKGHGRRAYSTRNRNTHWKGIVSKHGRSVHIHPAHENEAEAFKVESNLIKELRKKGCKLVNLTDGGEGPSGRVLTQEQKKRVSEVHLGKKLSPYHAERLHSSVRGKPSHFRVLKTYQIEEILKDNRILSEIAKTHNCCKTLIGKIKQGKATHYLESLNEFQAIP